jgi:hypothetical protein
MICRMRGLPTVATGHKSRQKVVGQVENTHWNSMGRSATVGRDKLLIRLARAAPLLGIIEGIGVPIDRHRLRY